MTTAITANRMKSVSKSGELRCVYRRVSVAAGTRTLFFVSSTVVLRPSESDLRPVLVWWLWRKRKPLPDARRLSQKMCPYRCVDCCLSLIAELMYTVSQRKVHTFKLSVTLSNLNRFSKILHCWKACEICYKTHATLPHLRHVATLPWENKNSAPPL